MVFTLLSFLTGLLLSSPGRTSLTDRLFSEVAVRLNSYILKENELYSYDALFVPLSFLFGSFNHESDIMELPYARWVKWS